MKFSIPGLPGVYYDTDAERTAISTTLTLAGRRAPKPHGYAAQLLPLLWSIDVDLREVPPDHPLQYLHPEGARSLEELPRNAQLKLVARDADFALRFAGEVNDQTETAISELVGEVNQGVETAIERIAGTKDPDEEVVIEIDAEDAAASFEPPIELEQVREDEAGAEFDSGAERTIEIEDERESEREGESDSDSGIEDERESEDDHTTRDALDLEREDFEPDEDVPVDEGGPEFGEGLDDVDAWESESDSDARSSSDSDERSDSDSSSDSNSNSR